MTPSGMKYLPELKRSTYQLVPLAKLLSSGQDALLVCDGVGVGKTISAGYILTHLISCHGRPGLVVCPPGLQEKWQLELKEKFQLKTTTIRTKEECFFVSDDWDRAGSSTVNILSNSILQARDSLRFEGPVVFDEIHNYRNRTTKLWLGAKSLAQHASHRIGLSATPINNGITDLSSELALLLNLDPDVADAVVAELWQPEKQHILHVVMTRFSKERLEIHFAKRQVHDVQIILPDEYMNQVAAAVKALRSRPQSEKIYLDEITYFRLGASSPSAFRKATGLQTIDAPQKLNALRSILQMHTKASVIVFCEFEVTAQEVAGSVDNRPSFLITGSVPVFEREAILNLFRDSPDGVLILTSVGAEGLDLQFCSTLVNYDLTWNPMVLEQRIGRIDRIGQRKNTIDIYNFVVEGSIDLRIIRTLGQKLGLIEGSILETNTILAAQSPMRLDMTVTDEFDSEVGKARDIVRAIELFQQYIPEDYELAGAIDEQWCDSSRIRTSDSDCVDLIEKLAPKKWLIKMHGLGASLTDVIRNYAS